MLYDGMISEYIEMKLKQYQSMNPEQRQRSGLIYNRIIPIGIVIAAFLVWGIPFFQQFPSVSELPTDFSHIVLFLAVMGLVVVALVLERLSSTLKTVLKFISALGLAWYTTKVPNLFSLTIYLRDICRICYCV